MYYRSKNQLQAQRGGWRGGGAEVGSRNVLGRSQLGLSEKAKRRVRGRLEKVSRIDFCVALSQKDCTHSVTR